MKEMSKFKKYNKYIKVSSDGRVVSLDTNHEYKPHDNGHGYLSVCVERSYKGEVIFKLREYIHRLVYKTFVGEIPEGYEIHHLDFDKSNNNLSNLKLVTPLENMQYNVLHGYINTINANEDTRQPIIVYDKSLNKEYTFNSIKEASLFFGYNKHRFSHILNRHNGETKRFKIIRVKETRCL